MKKAITSVVLVAVVVAGFGFGAVLGGPAEAAAQETETTEQTDTERTTLSDVLSGLVTDGVITQEQADAVAEAIEEADLSHRHHGQRGARLQAVAGIIGIEAEALRDALREDGATLASVANDNGVSTEALVDALVAEAEAKIAEAIEDGRISQEEADEKFADLEERITERVNSERPNRGEGRRGFGPRGGNGDAEGADAGLTFSNA